MSSLKSRRTHLYHTQPVKKAAKTFAPAVLPAPPAPDMSNFVAKEEVNKIVQNEIEKAKMLQEKEAMRYRLPYNLNRNTNPDRKPLAGVSYSYLRQLSIAYPIARACINRRVRQLTQLDWTITTGDSDKDKQSESIIEAVTTFFRKPMGSRTTLREMLTLMLEDILVCDATAFEYQRTRGGGLLYLVPVDPTTIVLKVTETGGTPEPPETAYAQFIHGKKVAEFSTRELFYSLMNRRSYTPYGLSPLESLVIQIESALSGSMYNYNYFKDNNVPEGFITLPEEVANTPEQVKQWQEWFDLLFAGDPRFMRRLKILPGNSEYQASKKPEDMAFEKFEMWLLQQTCAVFDVQPQDIGITYQVNKATSQTQQDLSKERGLQPLANYVKEQFDYFIKEELMFAELEWGWVNLNPVDRKEEAEIADMEIKSGTKTINEQRREQGREPIEGGDRPMVAFKPTFLDEPIEEQEEPTTEPEEGAQEVDEEEKEKMQTLDLRRWKKCVYKDLEKKREIRTKFASKYILPSVHNEIAESLKEVTTKAQARALFDLYINPEVRSAMTVLKVARALREQENE